MPQAVQAPPFEPQNWFVSPASQVAPLQQPSGQLEALQMQAPPLQVWPLPQVVHTSPPVPQD